MKEPFTLLKLQYSRMTCIECSWAIATEGYREGDRSQILQAVVCHEKKLGVNTSYFSVSSFFCILYIHFSVLGQSGEVVIPWGLVAHSDHQSCVP